MSLVDPIETFALGTCLITVDAFERKLRELCPRFPRDVLEEMVSIATLPKGRHDMAGNETVSSQSARQVLRYAYRRRYPCYDPIQQRHAVCLDPARCVVSGHARRGRWEGQRYVPGWLKAMAMKIDRHPTRSGVRREWQSIVLTTAPATSEDPKSIRDMIAACQRFSRRGGFRWDHLFCGTNPRREADHRIIKSPRDEYLLEARIELVPAGTRALAYRKDMYSDFAVTPASSVCQPALPAQPGWRVRWLFAYYGDPLGEDEIARLEKRWLRHPRNRGRDGVTFSFQLLEEADDVLDQMQLYRTTSLALGGAERAELACLRSEYRVRRVFRLGAGRGHLKRAKAIWKEALAITDRRMFASPVLNERWAQAIVGAKTWREAMSMLADEEERQWAYKYRWKHRRETVYPELLRRKL